jgi:predicted N-acetyltransferase YhbS
VDALHDTELAFRTIWARFIGGWERGALCERDGVAWVESPIRHLPYNGVIECHLTGDAEAAIAEVVRRFRERNVDWYWAVHPLSTPADVAARLEAARLVRVETMTCMVLDLAQVRSRGPTVGVEIAEAADARDLAAYTRLTLRYWEIGDDDAEQVAALHAAFGPRPQFGVRFLARLGGAVVGKAFLCLEAGRPGLAAIFGMSVLPEARGRGIGGAITDTILARAHGLGYRRVVLHSSAMAERVYRRAGFEPLGPLQVYATAPLWSGEH